MSAEMEKSSLFAGEQGYVHLDAVKHNGRKGALLHYENPNPAKMHAIDTQGMLEMEQAVSALEGTEGLEFCVLYGSYDLIHAGADVTEFRGDCDIDAIGKHLKRGTRLDARIKKLWPRMRTVGIFTGDRYGGSVEWPLFAEWGICDKDTRIQLSEVHLGIIPGWNGVLNVHLKCGPERALYMGQTGNTLYAQDMLRCGIVQEVVETPEGPERKVVAPEDWKQAWQNHSAKAGPILLDAALRLASNAEAPVRRREFPDTEEGKQARSAMLDSLMQEIADRTDIRKYEELHDRIAREASALRKLEDEDGLKALGKKAFKELLELRKPLAPLAVKAVSQFVAELMDRTRERIFAEYEDLGLMEAELCTSLMETEHRRIGVNAVLSRNPEDKVPVFD